MMFSYTQGQLYPYHSSCWQTPLLPIAFFFSPSSETAVESINFLLDEKSVCLNVYHGHNLVLCVIV